jgi:hypothetical protein
MAARKQTNRLDHLSKELRCVRTIEEAYDIDVVSWGIMTHDKPVSGKDVVLKGGSQSVIKAQ